MTENEQKSIENLTGMVLRMQVDNKIMADKLSQVVESINTKVGKKHIPIALEQDILQVTQQSIQKAIHETLTKFDSPLIKLVKSVVEENSSQLKSIISESFNDAITKEEFKSAIKDGFSHKIARVLVSGNDGLFDKVSSKLKQDSLFKAKMALAVVNVVNECLENR